MQKKKVSLVSLPITRSRQMKQSSCWDRKRTEDETPKKEVRTPLPMLTLQLLPTITGLNALVSDELELLEVFCMCHPGSHKPRRASGK